MRAGKKSSGAGSIICTGLTPPPPPPNKKASSPLSSLPLLINCIPCLSLTAPLYSPCAGSFRLTRRPCFSQSFLWPSMLYYEVNSVNRASPARWLQRDQMFSLLAPRRRRRRRRHIDEKYCLNGNLLVIVSQSIVRGTVSFINLPRKIIGHS